jgi:hypothetical protein
VQAGKLSGPQSCVRGPELKEGLKALSAASSFQTSSTMTAIWLKASGLNERRVDLSVAMKTSWPDN